MEKISFKQVFKGSVSVLGGSLKYPQNEKPEVERWIVTLPPQSFGDWHIHLVPEFFYVQTGTLYVVNELEDKSLAVATFGDGDHGLTDCHVPQFIWNPDKTSSVTVIAIYFGCSGIEATQSLGKKPSQELLNNLLDQTVKNNLTEESNLAGKRKK